MNPVEIHTFRANLVGEQNSHSQSSTKVRATFWNCRAVPGLFLFDNILSPPAMPTYTLFSTGLETIHNLIETLGPSLYLDLTELQGAARGRKYDLKSL